jgi:hypothetical protein
MKIILVYSVCGNVDINDVEEIVGQVVATSDSAMTM